MEPEDSLPYSQKTTAGPYPSSQLPTHFL